MRTHLGGRKEGEDTAPGATLALIRPYGTICSTTNDVSCHTYLWLTSNRSLTSALWNQMWRWDRDIAFWTRPKNPPCFWPTYIRIKLHTPEIRTHKSEDQWKQPKMASLLEQLQASFLQYRAIPESRCRKNKQYYDYQHCQISQSDVVENADIMCVVIILAKRGKVVPLSGLIEFEQQWPTRHHNSQSQVTTKG